MIKVSILICYKTSKKREAVLSDLGIITDVQNNDTFVYQYTVPDETAYERIKKVAKLRYGARFGMKKDTR